MLIKDINIDFLNKKKCIFYNFSNCNGTITKIPDKFYKNLGLIKNNNYCCSECNIKYIFNMFNNSLDKIVKHHNGFSFEYLLKQHVFFILNNKILQKSVFKKLKYEIKDIETFYNILKKSLNDINYIDMLNIFS